MKTNNSGRILMTPGVTAAPFSEAMPAHPQNGDEVIAVNVGSSTYTLTGSITGGDLVLDAGESAILVWAGATWIATWNSGSGGVTYPITATRGGTGADNSGAGDTDVLAFDIGTGTFLPVPLLNVGVTLPLGADLGGTGADLSGLADNATIFFDGTKFAESGILSSADGALTFPGIANPTPPAPGNALLHARTPATGVTRLEVDNEFDTNVVVGRDTVFVVKNATGGMIPKFALVYANGQDTGIPTIDYADASNAAKMPCIGTVLNDIDAGDFGQVMRVGIAEGLDLSMFAVGDQLYVSPSAAGSATTTRPEPPNIVQLAAIVLSNDAVAGEALATIAPALLGVETGTNAPSWTSTGVGTPAHVAIGSGVSVDATINLTAILPGVVGNVYTVEIVSGAPTPDVALGVVEAGTVTTITLGTDGAGVLDPAKNTATLVLAALSGSTLFTGALAGTGADSLEVESQLFFGGTESVMVAGSAHLGATGFLWVMEDTGGIVFEDVQAPGSTSQILKQDLSDGLIRSHNGLTGTASGFAARPVDGGGTDYIDIQVGNLQNSGVMFTGVVIGETYSGGVPQTAQFGITGFGGIDTGGSTLLVNGTQSVVLSDSTYAAHPGVFGPNAGIVTMDLGDPAALIADRWRNGYFSGVLETTGTGLAASSHIGSGTDGTVNLVADDPGIAGNGFTATVAAGVGLNVPMTAAFTLQALLVTLGTDGAGALDPAKNTATLIAGAINTAAGGVTATASGTGADPLTGAEGPTTFTGGAESLTLAGGLSANANIYLTNLPGSDPGIPGALYQTAGAVMVSL